MRALGTAIGARPPPLHVGLSRCLVQAVPRPPPSSALPRAAWRAAPEAEAKAEDRCHARNASKKKLKAFAALQDASTTNGLHSCAVVVNAKGHVRFERTAAWEAAELAHPAVAEAFRTASAAMAQLVKHISTHGGAGPSQGPPAAGCAAAGSGPSVPASGAAAAEEPAAEAPPQGHKRRREAAEAAEAAAAAGTSAPLFTQQGRRTQQPAWTGVPLHSALCTCALLYMALEVERLLSWCCRHELHTGACCANPHGRTWAPVGRGEGDEVGVVCSVECKQRPGCTSHHHPGLRLRQKMGG